MVTVILDTDFLSAFLKIGRCDLIRVFYQVERVYIPAAVYREMAQTDLLVELLAIDWIKLLSKEMSTGLEALDDAAFQRLGAGERACILLAHRLPEAMLLMNDNKARRFAQSQGITVVNVPSFLLACKLAGLIGPEQMLDIIHDLETKDHYSFRAEVRDMLLKSE